MAAAAQTMAFTGLDQANFGENRTRIIGHGWAYVVRDAKKTAPDCIRATDGSLSHLLGYA